ncbi:helix-turn-helix domain-containing protein [Micromonospora sp. NBC_00421]|uniref:helix-turn-helix domain-containing protein n=1 Tax=Micromonospora sp. NBC_00421 TaxID=2975976 RepID=UPI002E1D0AF8
MDSDTGRGIDRRRLVTWGGARAVTTRGVAERARVRAPTIYRLFGDKDGLVEAVAETWSARADRWTRTWRAQRKAAVAGPRLPAAAPEQESPVVCTVWTDGGGVSGPAGRAS